MKCAECGGGFKPIRRDQIFCGKLEGRKCKDVSRNRAMRRASEIYRLAYWWRAGGKTGFGGAISDISWLIDQWRSEDKERGLAPPPKPRDRGAWLSFVKLTQADTRRRRAKELLTTKGE